MKKDRIIKLTEILHKVDFGWVFLNPSRRYQLGEIETHVNVNKISSFSRINPKNGTPDFIDYILAPSEPVNVNLEPYTYLEIVGGKNLLVKETPETIKKLMDEN